MNKNSYSLIAMVLILISCEANLTTINEKTSNGALYKSYSIDKDSLIQGILQVFYEDGKTLFEESNYLNNKLNGTRTLYYESGQPEIIEQYKNDVLSDTLKVYHTSGNIKRLEYYDNGTLSGILKSYYNSGILKEEVTYANNVENGPFKEYHINGKLKWKGEFLEGDNEIGELIQFDSTGTMIKKMMCDSLSVCRTFWILEEDQQYSNG